MTNDPLVKHIAELIRLRRLEKKIGQGELARLIGTTRQSINGYENEKFLPQMQIMVKLAQLLDIDLNALKELS